MVGIFNSSQYDTTLSKMSLNKKINSNCCWCYPMCP